MILNCCNYALEIETRKNIELSMQQNQSCALLSLLRMLCDVVVKTDGSGRIMEDALAFAGLLLNLSRKSMKGVRIQDFMPDAEDKAAFSAHLSANKSRVASLFHSVLQDASGYR